MKTTVEIPNALIRQVNASAAARGQSPEYFIREAVREKLANLNRRTTDSAQWIRFFGAGKAFAESIREIDREIERESG